MKDLKQYILESNNIDDETYVIYEFSLNDLQSDNYMSKLIHTTYENRRIIVVSDKKWGIRYYTIYILKVRELKNCFAEYKYDQWSNRKCWLAPDELQGKKPKEIEEYIEKNSDNVYMDEFMSKDRQITINVKR